jgi:membrane protein YqaA with SNARE-associated domain
VLIALGILACLASAALGAAGTWLIGREARDTAARRAATGRHPSTRQARPQLLTFIPRPRPGGPNDPRKGGTR